MTLQDVQLELVKEDSCLAAQGEISAHQTSLTSFLMAGLEWKSNSMYHIMSILFD